MGTIFNKGFHHKYIRPCPLIFQASQHLTLDMLGPRDETGHGWSSLGRMLSILTSVQWCLPFVLPLQHYIFQLILRWQGKSYNRNHRIQQPHSLQFVLTCLPPWHVAHVTWIIVTHWVTHQVTIRTLNGLHQWEPSFHKTGFSTSIVRRKNLIWTKTNRLNFLQLSLLPLTTINTSFNIKETIELQQ